MILNNKKKLSTENGLPNNNNLLYIKRSLLLGAAQIEGRQQRLFLMTLGS
jgi:hypothetical protein